MKQVNIFQKQIDELTVEIDKTKDINLYVQRAQLYEQINNQHLCIKDLVTFLCHLDPNYVTKMAVTAIIYKIEEFDPGELNEIDTELNEVKKKFSNNPTIYYILGRFYTFTGNNRKVANNFKKAIKLNPSNEVYYHGFATYYANQEKNDKAIEVINDGLIANPVSSHLLTLRAKVNYMDNNIQEAFKDIDQAIKLDPENPDAYVERAIYSAEHKNYDEAIKDISKSILLNPDQVGYLLTRNSFHQRNGNFKEALNDLNTAIEREPESSFLLFNRAEFYYLEQEEDMALKDIEKAIEIDPQYAEYYNMKGLILEAIGNDVEADKCYNKADTMTNSCYSSNLF